MALHLHAFLPCCCTSRSLQSLSPIRVRTSSIHGPIQCMAAADKTSDDQTITKRRSANFQPTIWDYGYIQSVKTVHAEEAAYYKGRVDKLKGELRMMIGEVVYLSHHIQLIDMLQRLGLSYHFEDEIDRILTSIYNSIDHTNDEYWKEKGLCVAALEFRLLRQHGHNVSQEIFTSFMNETGNFTECLCEDTKGLLCLYEASYLSVEGENILEKARDFTTKHLQDYVINKPNKDEELSILISHALELPLHWRMPRLESRWFIDVYERRQDKNHVLLELAKLDFNMVQAIHQEDLKHMSSWWSNTGLAENLSFARNRLMENFLWTVGLASEPRFGYTRRMLTKVNALVTTIDDVYDVYGTLDELKLFTDAVERWDINAMEQLPYYMKICFFALYNSTNEMAFDALKTQGINIISYLKRAWADLCKAYLLEAEWYYSSYTPSLQEYIDNAWVSISAPVILVHAYFFTTNPVTKEAMKCLEEYHIIIRWSSMILRLADDLGTSSDELKRGDVPKSIQCYMHETGASEEDAREHIRHLIRETWSKMNEDGVENSHPFSKDFVKIAMNLARMAQCMYQHGDGHTCQDQLSKDRILSLLIQPIPFINRDHVKY